VYNIIMAPAIDGCGIDRNWSPRVLLKIARIKLLQWLMSIVVVNL